jgi:hypothetical protein
MLTAKELIERLQPLGRNGARRVLLAAWAQLSLLEQAALAMNAEFWRSPPKGLGMAESAGHRRSMRGLMT